MPIPRQTEEDVHVRRIATVRLRTPTLASGAVVLGDRASAGVLAVITCYHDLDHAAAVPAVDLVRRSIGRAGGQRDRSELQEKSRRVNTLAQFPRRAPPWGPRASAGLFGSGPTHPAG